MADFNIDIKIPESSEKLRLEVEIEQSLAKGDINLGDLCSNNLFTYIERRSLEEISSELLHLTLKRLLILIGNAGIDQQHAIDLFLQEAFTPENSQISLSVTLDKNRAAVCRRLLNAARSIDLAMGYSKIGSMNTAFKIILSGALEIYGGDQSFYSQKNSSASEIAAEGGLARAEIYRPTKEKACALLIEMEPENGWTSRPEAHKSVLPEIKRYLAENNIKMPSVYSIESTLREWLKNDPLVSKAVRIAD